MHLPGPTRPAPGSLDLIRLFLNTTDREDGTDEFETVAGARAWLVAQGLLRRSGRLAESDRQRLIALREALRALTFANNGGALEDDSLAGLNRQAAEAALVPAFCGGESFALAGHRGDVTGAISSLLAVVCEAMRDGTWSRLKACRNPHCQWAFYDTSRNRTGNWCSMAVCGNRAKTRAYRQRQKAIAQ